MTKTKTVEDDNVVKTDVESKVEETEEETKTGEETIEPLKGDIDYAKLLEEEKHKTADAEKASADLAFKLREAKRKKEEGEDDEKSLTESQLNTILDKREQRLKSETLKPILEGMANELASSDDEAQLILEIHKNRVWPEGSTLAQQLSDAHAIANKGKLSVINSELKRALKSKGTKSDANPGTFRDSETKTDTVMSANDISALLAAGYIFSSTDGLYKKKLPRGKNLCYDPKTGKTFKIS